MLAGEFDMRVKSCEASDGRNRPISLSDENGCVLRKKMFSKFMKMRSTDARATVVTYAFFHAFKFPDSMAVNIRCKVSHLDLRIDLQTQTLTFRWRFVAMAVLITARSPTPTRRGSRQCPPR